uniref:Uncharacterized protein n=1 Tax=Medicago truncatula TaxID=3880 RepID=B7FJJ3_MEDTR|nr:unknown [Medicago truncatula]
MRPHGMAEMGLLKEFGSPLSFSSFQDLDLFGGGGGGGDQLDLQQNMDKQTLDHHGFMQINENLCLGKKRPNPNTNPYSGNGKNPLMWSDDLRLQDLGTASSCLDDPFKGDQIQIAPPSLDRGSDIETIDIYDTKPLLQGEI